MEKDYTFETQVATNLFCLEDNEGTKTLFYFLEDAQNYSKENNIQGSITVAPLKRLIKVKK